jgi:Zn-dependent protease
MHLPPFESMLAIAIVIFFAIGLHEYGHCKMADLCGDPTPRFYGRVTLNLFKHFEVLGTIMIIFTSLAGIGIGWGKPSPIDPSRMRNPRWDAFATTAAGPISNLFQATFWAILLRIFVHTQLISGTALGAGHFGAFLVTLVSYGVIINISLMLFNLIPLGPLDGHWLLGTFLPESVRAKWFFWNRTTGSIALLIIILGGQFTGIDIVGKVIGPPMGFIFQFLTGIH